jgi:hypothetical protein
MQILYRSGRHGRVSACRSRSGGAGIVISFETAATGKGKPAIGARRRPSVDDRWSAVAARMGTLVVQEPSKV